LQRLLDSGAGGGRRPRRRHDVVGHRRDAGGEAEIIARERAGGVRLGVVEAVFTRFDWRTRASA
jgi:hypothetical protein